MTSPWPWIAVVGSASGADLQSRINRWVRDDPIAGGDVAHIAPVLRLALLGAILGDDAL